MAHDAKTATDRGETGRLAPESIVAFPLLGIAYGSTIGGMATLVGAAPRFP